MCGIFGYVATKAEHVDRIDVAAGLRALAHRGPDGRGTFSEAKGGTHCSLVHARLAIIDLSAAGEQPMRSSTGRYVITYNGEVFNHAAVRRELEAEGITLRSSSDTEVIVEAYALWGPASLERLRGMFAFAIWDSLKAELFVARDRLGVKPLYIVEQDGLVAFASEIRALIASRTVPPRLSPQGLRSYLEWGSVAEPATILENVTSLLPGTCLTLRNGRATKATYWRPFSTSPLDMSLDQAAEQIRPVLREAVKLRLVADVPVGVFLSGGIDSSVITAIASSESEKPLHTFTVAFEEHDMNEGEYAETVASHFGCKHHHILLSQERMRDELDDALAALDQPSADGTNTFFVARAVRAAGLSVALSGLGGDELFAGYGYFRQFSAALRLAGAGRRAAGTWLESLASLPSLPWLPRSAPKLAALLGGQHSEIGAYAALRCMFTPKQSHQILSREVPASDRSSARYWDSIETPGGAKQDPVNLFSVLDLSNYMRNTLLRDADVMSMAHALEVRVPLLDHKLVELALAMPGAIKLARNTNKPLLVAAAPAIPPRAQNRKKMGFTLPFDSWLRGPLKPRMTELIGEASVNKLGFLSAPAINSLWNAFLAGDGRVTFSRVWSIAALVAWCETNGAFL